VDQANVGNTLTNVATNTRIADRWFLGKAGSVTGTINTQCSRISAGIKLPGTNFVITGNQQLLQIGTTQAALAAGDQVRMYQLLEGPQWRELQGDVHSLSILALSSTVAPYTFSVSIRDSPATKSLVNLLTIPTAATWTLLTIPNMPAFPVGNFSNGIGSLSYEMDICIACGTTYQAPATGSWQSGNFLGAAGMTNGLAAANNLFFAFVQHEPGPQCTTLIDCPFSGPNGNLEACQRYYQKSYDLATAPGAITNAGSINFITAITFNGIAIPIRFHKTMAKVPTVTVYSSTGAINNIRDTSGGVDVAVSSIAIPGTSGYSGVNTSSNVTAGHSVLWHHTADTGW
jgi:hypothetical protein